MDEKVKEGLRFTRAALDVLNSLEEEAKSAAMDALASMVQQTGLDKELSLINMGSRSTPSLLVVTSEDVNLGSIDISLEGKVTTRLEANWEQQQENVDMLKENLKHFDKKMREDHVPVQEDAVQEAFALTTATPQTMEQMASVQEATINRIEAMKDTPEKEHPVDMDGAPINWDKGATEARNEPNEGSKNAEERGNEASPSLWQQRKEIQAEIKDEKAEIISLNKDIRNKTAMAYMRGLTKEDRDFINGTAAKVTEHTLNMIAKREKMPSTIDCIKDGTSRTIDTCIYNIGWAFDRGIQAGKNTLHKIADAVGQAIEQSKAIGVSAFAGLAEKVAQHHRENCMVAYGNDKILADNTEKLCDALEKRYRRRQEVKTAVKDGFANIGRAFMGKERVTSEAQLNSLQASIIESYREDIKFYRENMDLMMTEFQISAAASEHRLEKAQERREAAGLDRSEKLSEKADTLKESREKFTGMTDATLDECKKEAATKKAERGSGEPSKETKETDVLTK